MPSQILESELIYRVAFSYAPGVGPITFQNLLAKFTSAENAYKASSSELSSAFQSPKYLENFLSFRKTYQADRTLHNLITRNIQILTYSASDKPVEHSAIIDYPICLYAKGDPELLTSAHIKIAVIGTRKPTSYGIQNTQDFTQSLVEHNAIILSGLALGIDALAHETTLKANGKTIAILGSGFNCVHPRQNLRLYNSIIEHQGLVLTEFPPHTPPLPQNFPLRNRLISGFSKGVLVIEGNAHSGTRITAKHALETGKDVFAIPGSIHSPLSATPNFLIQSGAQLVSSAQDIIEAFGLIKSPRGPAGDISTHIHAALLHHPSNPTTLAEALHIPLPIILTIFTQLELSGHIRKLPNNMYSA